MKRRVALKAIVFMLMVSVCFAQAGISVQANEMDTAGELKRADSSYKTDIVISDELKSLLLQYLANNRNTVLSYAGTGSRGYFNSERMESRFTQPYGISVSNDGSIIVSDTYNNLIRKISLNEVTTIAGNIMATDDYGYQKGSHMDGELDKTLLNRPSSIVFNKMGEPFIADSGNHVIRFIRDNKMFTFSGSTAGYFNGTDHTSKFNNPMAIAIDENDNIYVADTLNQCIRKVDTNGNTTTIAGVPGKSGFMDGTEKEALFNSPAGIAVSKNGKIIYVADTGNHRIRKIENGNVTTLAGKADVLDADNEPFGGFKDGIAAEAMFNLPRGLTLAEGNLIIADSGNNRIRVLSKSGKAFTLCGSGEPGDKDGAPDESLLNYPTGVFYSDSVVYIADTANNKIKTAPFKAELYN